MMLGTPSHAGPNEVEGMAGIGKERQRVKKVKE